MSAEGRTLFGADPSTLGGRLKVSALVAMSLRGSLSKVTNPWPLYPSPPLCFWWAPGCSALLVWLVSGARILDEGQLIETFVLIRPPALRSSFRRPFRVAQRADVQSPRASVRRARTNRFAS